MLDVRKLQWDEQYLLLKRFQEREGHCKVPFSHTEDGANLGRWTSTQRQRNRKETLDSERQKRLEKIGFEWGLTYAATWDEMYALLKQFKKREGHCNVPRSHKEDGANLGIWAHRQRQLKKKETLDPDRETHLEEIGFGRAPAATWDEMYALFKQFKKREMHCKVPFSHTEDGANLGMWTSTQRQLKKKETLDSQRQKRLDEIGFEWGLTYAATWDETYALLQKFKMREGHCKVPSSHKDYEAKLGTWMKTQRQLYRKEKLDPERQKRLEEIGFEWELASARWDEMYALLKQFKKREGHCNVPQSHTEEGANAGMWVSDQRQLNRKKKLDPERHKRLEDIGLEWGFANVTWDEMYALLKQFEKREGHCKVPRSHIEDGAKLGTWVETQHQPNRKETLGPERQTRLEKIGFEWGLTFAATWDEMYVLLRQFKKREGHCKVPFRHTEDGANLGEWTSNQRRYSRKEKLDPERQKRLEEIGFDWGFAKVTWDDMYALLKQFEKREGHCTKVPVSHIEDRIGLGSWLKHQRKFKKDGTLDPDRQTRLEEIGWCGSCKKKYRHPYYSNLRH
jgi:phosphosulfolactate phosphohydrolase-like enzyme